MCVIRLALVNSRNITGRKMSGTLRGVDAPVTRWDEHEASAAESERGENFRSIEWLGRLRRRKS
jgi:hypothetical protein